MRSVFSLLASAIIGALSFAGSAKADAGAFLLQPRMITEWKAIYARVEARDTIPARARLSGTLVELHVTEGDVVTAGQVLARIVDKKLTYQLAALDAQLLALESQLAHVDSERERSESLLERGLSTTQARDGFRTQVQVYANQIAAAKAERRVVEQQIAEGNVLAPLQGRALMVPMATGSVVTAGETVAVIGGGGFVLRLAVPERHAGNFQVGDRIEIETDQAVSGRISRIYPQIENGRVIADVEVEGLSDAFVNARVQVHLPIGQRQALLLPVDAVETVSGIDFVTVAEHEEPVKRAVVVGEERELDGVMMVEIITGLSGGESVMVGDHE